MLLTLTLTLAALATYEGDHSGSVRQPLPAQEVIDALPADGGEEFNRLVFESSPYLQQHARNPVDWYPWGEEAFALAKKLDRPIFLSIGYSTCHWCHVMEHESFEDEEVAKLMNETFVCVKVDREERPDVDQVYMRVTQAMTGSGGWPMTIVMTPEREPFFAGTYFPKSSRRGGRPGMLELIPELDRVWKKERKEVRGTTERVMEFLRQKGTGEGEGEVGDAEVARAFRQLRSRFDSEYGGFGSDRKFPTPSNLTFLMRHYARTAASDSLAMVEKTLTEMRLGGVWDHVGFGFHRYSIDREWLVPHFEKMLYDQALIAMAYTEAWQLRPDPLFRRTVEEIFTYVLRDMTDAGGGFYSAEDADSEGEEGLFYLWKEAELQELLSEEDYAFAKSVWNVHTAGNYRDEATGRRTQRNIPHLSRVLDDEGRARLEGIRARLFEVREARVHPLKDDKILTDWNGLMIAAMAKAGRAFGDERYLGAAARAADFLLEELRDEKGRLYKLSRGGVARLDGLIDDYAYTVWGLIELYEANFDPSRLAAALELTDHVLEHFLDEEGGGFFTTPDYGEELLVRAKGVHDGARPSGNGVMAKNLVRLARLTGRSKYEEEARKALEGLASGVVQAPSGSTHLLEAADFLNGVTHEVVLVGERGDETLEAMLHELRTRFLPNVVVLLVTDETKKALAKLAPYTRSMKRKKGRATAYVCRDQSCDLPTNDVAKMLESLN